ncbi:DNA polymerase I [Helicobacter sp. 16-1353]|uniref:DNA polymerase I n=1 Tax=Helicobacter sp. 16-1353 TaxID=2004996 RepID=UPI000DCE02A3|nr:DNA polymerase I [Helicobacter sp. 16-1353]RAX54957.1 DNA polymerase I [Helicobacter sp. 16-1353]
MKTLSIIDTFGYFFRSFYAMPKLKSKDGRPTGVLLGFVNLINQLYNDDSSYIVFALEGEGDKIRRQIAPDYKANRPEADQELVEQIKVSIEWIKKMKLAYISIDGYEADDAIASLNKLANSKNIIVKIVSVDKDLYQLIDSNTYIYDPIKKKDIREAECFEKFGVYPKQFVDYQSLVGDTSDNISGIKGIGAKSAQKLISHFGSLDAIYENKKELQHFLTPKLIDRIINDKDSAYRSRELVILRDNLLDFFDLESMIKPTHNPLFLIEEELKSYDINILSKLTQNSNFKVPNKSLNLKDNNNIHTIKPFATKAILDKNELFDIINALSKDCVVAFDTETDSLDTKSANIIGFSFASNLDIGYYVPLNHFYLGVENQISISDAKIALQKLFSNHHIVGHNLKFDIAVVSHNFDLDILNYSDTMILAWLENTSQVLNLDYQVKKNFNYITIKFDEIVQKGDTFSSVNINTATKYAAQDAICTLALYYFFQNTLGKEQLDIALNVEFPFVKTIIEMESNGISIDRDFFVLLKNELGDRLKEVSNEIYRIAEVEFNINSTRQLGEILYNKLGLKKGRALKNSGYSTDEKTLESLIDTHIIIPFLLEYRELNKLLSTYVLPILNLANNNRIYTSFLQTGTSTGRLSSRNPNLQNIPVKTDIGRKIRYGFIAKDGYKLLSADYSQIELRLLAHFSKDPNLIAAFMNDKDIHLETALKIFGASLAQSKRNVAKSINFGLIYGMGVKKLAQTLKISQTQSKEYIESYFKNFPTVKDYLNKQEAIILENGYSQTLLGRRRIFDFHNIAEYERLAFLREGVNSIFQGSAADLIKLSMNECYKQFKNRDVKLLLQVHDELIFEIKEDEIDVVSKEILEIMNNIYKLNVPLKCGINIGKRWSELK